MYVGSSPCIHSAESLGAGSQVVRLLTIVRPWLLCAALSGGKD